MSDAWPLVGKPWRAVWWWNLADHLSHHVHLRPVRLRNWVCDRFDHALGVDE